MGQIPLPPDPKRQVVKMFDIPILPCPRTRSRPPHCSTTMLCRALRLGPIARATGRSTAGPAVVPAFVNSPRHPPLALKCQRMISNANELLTHVVPRHTHNCGALTAQNVGESVVLNGWLSSSRDIGKNLQFFALRDGHGVTQVMAKITPEMRQDWEQKYGFSSIPLESVISVTGKVIPRPKDQINSAMKTGEIEVRFVLIKIMILY